MILIQKGAKNANSQLRSVLMVKIIISGSFPGNYFLKKFYERFKSILQNFYLSFYELGQSKEYIHRIFLTNKHE